MTISSLRTAIVYENFIFTQEYTFAERCCFLTFSFEGKFRKYDISVKRKHTKTNENMIFSVLFTNFRKTKILIFMQCSEHLFLRAPLDGCFCINLILLMLIEILIINDHMFPMIWKPVN